MITYMRYSFDFCINALQWGDRKIGETNFVCVEMSDSYAKTQRRNIIQSNNDQLDRIWQYDAFVSYSKNDANWVNQYLLPELEGEEEYKLCLQERDCKIVAMFFENIKDSILCSRHAILVISPNFIANNLCQWELQLIQRSFDLSPSFLVLIELERLTHKELPTNLRLLMGTRTYLEWTAQNETRFWERLKLALGIPIRSSQAFRFGKQNDSAEISNISQENEHICVEDTVRLLSD
ncbi:hypothetical protein B566_EDAN002044 [Ephemera danica]|nr:hypothetical protein B566_EDAN002044 [Ephemera danica]